MAAFWLSVCRWRGRHLALEDAGFIVSGVHPVGGALLHRQGEGQASPFLSRAPIRRMCLSRGDGLCSASSLSTAVRWAE
jgi:hypothetical protein